MTQNIVPSLRNNPFPLPSTSVTAYSGCACSLRCSPRKALFRRSLWLAQQLLHSPPHLPARKNSSMLGEGCRGPQTDSGGGLCCERGNCAQPGNAPTSHLSHFCPALFWKTLGPFGSFWGL